MRRRGLVAILAFAAFATLPATAVVWRADATDAQVLALAADFDSVGQVAKGGLATLIAPRWALTAAHVAHPLVPGDLIRFGARDFAIARVVIHPQGAADPEHPRTPPEVDLALLELAEAVPADVASPRLPGRAQDELGQVAVIAGFGDHGPQGAPLARADGRLRAVENRVDDAGPLRLFLAFDAAPTRARPLEGIGAAGDSGGPLFIRGVLAGVSSGADGPPGEYGTTDVYVRVSAHIAWIESVAGAFREIETVWRKEPSWPRRSLIEGIEGWVVVQGVVGVDGKLHDARVVASDGSGLFDDPALRAFKQWRFKPRVLAGVAVEREVSQRLDFKLPR